jgi:HK97 family phage major capsid protein
MNINTQIKNLQKTRDDHYDAMVAYLAKDTGEANSDFVQATYDAMDTRLAALDASIAKRATLANKAAKKRKEDDADEREDCGGKESDDDEDDGEDKPGDNKEHDDDETDEKTIGSFGSRSPLATKSSLLGKSNTSTIIRHGKQSDARDAVQFIIGAGIMSKSGSLAAAKNYVVQNYNNRTVAKALQSNIQATGGAFIPQEMSQAWVDVNAALDTFNQLGIVNMPYDDRGNLTVPRLNGMNTASWVGEAQQMAVSQPTTDAIQLKDHIIASMVPITKQMINRSPFMVESILTRVMSRRLALSISFAGYFGTGSAYQPLGLQSLGTTLPPAVIRNDTNQDQLTDINNVLRAMRLAATSQNINLTGAKWTFHSAVLEGLASARDGVGNYFFAPQLDRGKLLGIDFLVDNQFPTNLPVANSAVANTGTVIFLTQPAEILKTESTHLLADQSGDATYWDGSAWQSAYQNQEIVFRVSKEMDWNIAHPYGSINMTVSGLQPSFWSGNNGGSAYSTQASNTSNSAAQSAYPTSTATPNT